MTNYQLIMTLLLRGDSYRSIQAQCGAAHATIAKARKVLREHNITTESQVLGIGNDALAALVGDDRLSHFSEFVTIDFDAAVKARTGRTKTPLNVLWAQYLDIPAAAGLRHYSYERYRQLVNQHIHTQGLTTRVHHSPGHTCQVDWAGTAMYLVDPLGSKPAKVSIFVATLPYSGMVFAHGFLNQRQPNWLMAHRLAFEYFGGVPEVIVPDNAATASNAISRGDRARAVNSCYEEFLSHYNTAAFPARALRPKDKANVESGVKIITNHVIGKLAGRDFCELDDLNTAIRDLVDAVNDRTPFRNQHTSRREIFVDAEEHLLTALPGQLYEPTVWKKAKVAPNWHIRVNTVHYSVPYKHVGLTVDVRIRGDVLDVFTDQETIATHRVITQRGGYVTDTSHCPPGMEAPNNLWTKDYFLTQALRVGPHTTRAVESLLDSTPIVAQAYLPARNILGMGKGDNKLVLEEACRRLIGTGEQSRAVSYTAVKNMMAVVRSDINTRPRTAPQQSAPQRRGSQSPFTPGSRRGLLGGAEQFDLDTLMGTTKEDQ